MQAIELEGIKGEQKAYLTWLLSCSGSRT